MPETTPRCGAPRRSWRPRSGRSPPRASVETASNSPRKDRSLWISRGSAFRESRLLNRRRVAAHAVEERREQAVGEGVGVATRPQPRVRPVRSREEEERRRRHVEVGAEGAPLDALAVEVADPLLVAASLRKEALAPLALERAPLAREHGRDVELIGDDTQVAAQCEP